jgi:hypothetical protein
VCCSDLIFLTYTWYYDDQSAYCCVNCSAYCSRDDCSGIGSAGRLDFVGLNYRSLPAKLDKVVHIGHIAAARTVHIVAVRIDHIAVARTGHIAAARTGHIAARTDHIAVGHIFVVDTEVVVVVDIATGHFGNVRIPLHIFCIDFLLVPDEMASTIIYRLYFQHSLNQHNC